MRSVWPPPIVTLLGFAVKLSTVGGGHDDAMTVVCALALVPQPTVAIKVYVVVDCGCEMSTKPLGLAKVPTPGILMVSPVPDGSLTDHDSLTNRFPPIKTELGFEVKELIAG